METKLQPIDLIDLRFADANPGVFSGYASKFNGVDSYGDTILPGAYAQTLTNRERPVHLRWNHFGPIIGKWLAIEEDDVGLRVDGELTPNHSVAQDVYASMKHGAVTGLSIGFRIPPGGSEKDGKLRKLKHIDLVEISVVESPADLGARVASVKSIIEEAETLKELESLLRDAAGFSRADATALVSRVKALSRGERAGEIDTGDLVEAIKATTRKLTRGK